MYKVLKPSGHNANITLENTETKASIIIGRMSMKILKVLEGEGYSTSATEKDKQLELTEEWQLHVKEDTAKELSKLAMPMKKPIRDQRKIKSEQQPVETDNRKIDAMDVLLGLASYYKKGDE